MRCALVTAYNQPKKYRNILLLVWGLIFPLHNIVAQERYIYIDNCENFVTESKYDIKRIVKNDPEKKIQYILHDYYPSGQLLTTGKAKAKNGNFKSGNYTFYHQNGIVMAEGKFENDQKVGDWKYWDSLGNEIKKDSVLRYSKETNYTVDSINYKGKCFCYKRELTWLKRNILSNKTTEYVYADGNEIAVDGVYQKTDEQAKYKYGINKFYEYLSAKLKYPLITWLKGKHGKVFVKFIINKEGILVNPTCLVSLDKTTDRKIKKALLNTKNNWIPAKYNGENVGSILILPLTYALN